MICFVVYIFVLGITEPVIRGLCKVLQLTLLRYRDGASRSYVKDTIIAMAKQHPDWTMKHLTSVLNDIAQTQSNLSPS